MQCPPFSGPFLPRMLISKSQVHLLCKRFSELRLFSIICLYSNLPKRQFRVLFQAQPSTVISATLELCHLFIVNSKHSVMQAFKLGPASWIQRTSIGRHHRTAGMNFRRVLVSTSSTAMERNSSTKDYLGKWKKQPRHWEMQEISSNGISSWSLGPLVHFPCLRKDNHRQHISVLESWFKMEKRCFLWMPRVQMLPWLVRSPLLVQ